MRRILIFTTIERAFYSSVIEYQLLEPVIGVTKKSKDKFTYTSFIPITFWISRKTPIESFIIFKKNRIRVKKWLNENGISCYFIPTIFPLRHNNFYLTIPHLILYLITSSPIFLMLLIFHRINLIHSRNYPASLLSFFAQKLFGIPYIFDMRDLYPEKGIEAGVFCDKSWSYKIWKFLELELIKSASYVITTSEPFKEYISSKFIPKVFGMNSSRKFSGRIKMLPNCVNTARFKPDTEKRNNLREKYGITDKFVLIHSGSFGTSVDMPITLKYFLHFKKLKNEWERGFGSGDPKLPERGNKKDVVLVILQGMKERLPEIRNEAERLGITTQELILLSPEPSEVPELLVMGDIGLHLESMAIATPYCIAVKDGEYLASGLPIIVTPYLKGIAPLIQKYSAGIAIDPLSPDKKEEIRLLDNYKEIRENSFRLVREELVLDKNIEKLTEIYPARAG